MTKNIVQKVWNRKKMNKGGQFLARDWLMSLIIFSGVVALATLMVTSIATEYDNPGIVDEDILEDFGNLQAATDIAGNAFDATN